VKGRQGRALVSEHARQIKIADLNALNAAFAVIPSRMTATDTRGDALGEDLGLHDRRHALVQRRVRLRWCRTDQLPSAYQRRRRREAK